MVAAAFELLQKLWEGWPCHLVANAEGTQVVLLSEPYLTALLPSYKKRVCQYCLHTHSKRLTTYCRECNQCWYCNQDCQEAHAAGLSDHRLDPTAPKQAHTPHLVPHRLTCPILKRFSSIKCDPAMESVIRMLLDAMALQRLEASSNLPHNSGRTTAAEDLGVQPSASVQGEPLQKTLSFCHDQVAHQGTPAHQIPAFVQRSRGQLCTAADLQAGPQPSLPTLSHQHLWLLQSHAADFTDKDQKDWLVNLRFLRKAMQQSDWPGIWSEEVLLDMVGRIAANNFGIYFGKRRQQTGSAAEPQQQHPVQQQHQGSLAHQNQGGMKQQQHQGSLTHQNQSSTKEEQQHQQQVGAPEHQQEPVDSDLCKHANGGGCNALSNGQGREQPQQQMQAASLEGHPSPAEASTSSHAGLPGATGKSNALLMWPMQEARSEATDAASPSEQSLAQATNGLQRWSCQCPELTSEHQHESITPSHKPSAAALQGFLNSAQHPSQATGRHTVCRDEAGAQLPGHTVENGNTEKGKTEDSKATQQLPLYGTSSRSLVQNSAADPAAALSGGEEVIGREMYITASLFNHSCEPNCVKRREQGQALGQAQSMAAVTALRDIEAGEALTISYIDLELPRSARQLELKTSFFFDCRCTRCERELTEGSKKCTYAQKQTQRQRQAPKRRGTKARVSR